MTMRKGIERLAYELEREDMSQTLGDLAVKYDEPLDRIRDALDVIKIHYGEPTQIPKVPW
jgi:hypothetical protein